GVAPEVVLYLDQAPSVAELDRIVTLLGVEPPAIVRNKEALYKELGLDTRTLSRQEWLQTLHDHPKLIERPIVVSGDRAVIGRPPENVQALFG
ncbi:MAG: arsenate reductase (glutaredoxin), partial [Candidatus Sericytochromatia bacterium]|nr:arsenate reductase (glutaredoxin) [Candidatus Sericytochromatia bacterium]